MRFLLKHAWLALVQEQQSTTVQYLVLTHADEDVQAELLVGHGVVGICVQHDECKGQKVGAI